MKILFLALGNEWVPSSRTRVFQFLPHLQRLGIQTQAIRYRTGLDYVLWAKCGGAGRETSFLFRLLARLIDVTDYFFKLFQLPHFLIHAFFVDAVIIQKIVLPAWAQNFLRRINPYIVFDFDDAIYLDNDSKNKKDFDHQLRLTKLAVVENTLNEEYAHNFKVSTLRITGPIDCERYRPRPGGPKSKEFVIGWIGSVSTAAYLDLILGPLQEISKIFPNVVVELIGSGHHSLSNVRMRNYDWSLDSEVELLGRFNVGIMPLPNSDYAQGKGGYKLLQYMAMGLPSVASPVGINTELVIPGETGFLAGTDSEWTAALAKLISSDDLRDSMGRRARDRAQASYSFETYAPLYKKALTDVLGRNV